MCPGVFNSKLFEADLRPEKNPNSNPFTFLLFRYGSADGMCRVPGAFLSGFVVVGTEGQTATNPITFLHSSS
jgi:hypothetical protein